MPADTEDFGVDSLDELGEVGLGVVLKGGNDELLLMLETSDEMGFTPESALLVGTQIHTAPEAFGKVMSATQPRIAVAYHFFKDFDTTGDIFAGIRSTYDGPLSLAEDFMVWNVTKEDIRVRMAVVEEHTWSPPLATAANPPDMADRVALSERLGWEVGYSDFILNGKWDVDDVLRPIYEETSRLLGREFPYPERSGQ